MPNDITTPVGRLVRGSLYDFQSTNMEGQPLVTKTGPNAGEPRVVYYFALALAKGAESHWNQTEWGQKIWAEGLSGSPNAAQSPTFAWKVTDGDDTSLYSPKGNERKIAPADREGHAGHWIMNFSSGGAPSIYSNLSGSLAPLLTEKAINPGDYIQVFGSVVHNGSTSQPGVYLNHRAVCLRGYGTRIILGVDPENMGFGDAPLPAGASTVPVANFSAPATAEMVQPAVKSPVPKTVPTPMPAATVPPVVPYPQILTPAVAPPTPVAKIIKIHPEYNPTGGITDEEYIAAGWTDEQLTQNGLL